MHDLKYLSRENSCWITWEIQVRNRSVSKALEIPLIELICNRPRAIKYPILIFKTLKILIRSKVKIVFVQNPSIVLSFFVTTLKSVLNLKVIVDAHNAGVYPLEGRSKILNYITKMICKRADYVLVTNSYIAEVIKRWNGTPFILPDPIPDFSQHPEKQLQSARPYLLFICTWATDEPYMEVIEAASMLKEPIDIYVTGNFEKKLTAHEKENMPTNVKLLGFVSEDDYVSYLRNSIAVIDLTTRDHCLVCGGYEAVAVEKPGLLSSSKVNSEVFYQGFLFTENNASSIRTGIVNVIKEKGQLEKDIKKLKQHHILETQQRILLLQTSLSGPA
jgi:glycosyltransferase involved in cell wall biosynthesis